MRCTIEAYITYTKEKELKFILYYTYFLNPIFKNLINL
ncbi:hypothetical protein FPSE_09734 [Fusarium pseudograminearum CS3096]|uniref:Uncharacterized protein n=1 Tax=Fusarium pseudograminearum (strain CS3096) TaxID=1028729 RepID=K3V9H4_FUSPC|nr:hypothetical protein FPSE_09734 [Fusarium pseudograminearum CS3096]EKJ70074.1 hypothetical protein FPSE_09734 [Fusarium pseudograminearum CS3096]